MNKTALNSQKEKHSMLSLRRATAACPRCSRGTLPFLSTLSLRRATRHMQLLDTVTVNFYPRSPCGERLVAACSGWASSAFLSTLSLRRATLYSRCFSTSTRISIHALLAESDDRIKFVFAERVKFLSTLSLRRATHGGLRQRRAQSVFLSTLSLRRATRH